MNIGHHIRTIPDFPKPGILFYDISTLLAHNQAWQHTVDLLSVATRPHNPEMLVGIESRGFLVAAPLALKLGCGFMMVRKQGKLPGETISFTYDLEYGSDTVEMQADAISPGQRVILLDDLLATGGTAGATVKLLRQAGAEVCAAAFIIELLGLGGREELDNLDVPVTSLLEYDA
ncbi:MAG: adenine phosphoribosyltransferase [Alphaproteobacteria bacterium]|nr:adenine phosphoribosyltransferase [Alphaproteobacteria bacterium]